MATCSSLGRQQPENLSNKYYHHQHHCQQGHWQVREHWLIQVATFSDTAKAASVQRRKKPVGLCILQTRENGGMLKSQKTVCGFIIVVLGVAFQRIQTPGLAVSHGSPIALADATQPVPVCRDYTCPVCRDYTHHLPVQLGKTCDFITTEVLGKDLACPS